MRLFDTDNWREIGASLSRNKTRTFLTAFGIFWGVLMLSLLWGAGQGVKRMMYSNFDGFATNSAIIYANRTTMPYKGFKRGLWWAMTTDDVDAIRRNVQGLETVSSVMSRGATITYKDKSESSTLAGVEPNYVKALTPKIVAGRFINDADLSQASRVCVLGESLAQRLFPGTDAVGKVVNINNIYYRVVGVCSQSSEIGIPGRIDESIFAPITTTRMAYNYRNFCDFLLVIADDNHRPGDIKDDIFRNIRKGHPIHPDDKEAIGFQDISVMFDQVSKIFLGLDILIFIVGLSSLLAGVIGVGNIMWVIVKERTKEFGVRRAIGAKPASILKQILSESAVLTAVAGMAAVVVSVGILQVATMMIAQAAESNGASHNLAVDFQLSFGHAVVILLLFLVLGMLAGSIPAFKAMHIKPIEALNDK
ncbi:MAG: ABC transporter permease [Muribaculaceae bacterium]|nr:ABC transporter permease [Muribaculaceae bacterium]